MKKIIIPGVLALMFAGGAAGHALYQNITVSPGTLVTFGPQRSGENPWSCQALGVNSAGWVETSCVDGDGLPVVRFFTRGNYNRVQVLACPPAKLQGDQKCRYHRNYYVKRASAKERATIFTFNGP